MILYHNDPPNITGDTDAREVFTQKLENHINAYYLAFGSFRATGVEILETRFSFSRVFDDRPNELNIRYSQDILYAPLDPDFKPVEIASSPFQDQNDRGDFLSALQSSTITDAYVGLMGMSAVTCPLDSYCTVDVGGPTMSPTLAPTTLSPTLSPTTLRPTMIPSMFPSPPPVPTIVPSTMPSLPGPTLTPSVSLVPTQVKLSVAQEEVVVINRLTVELESDGTAKNYESFDVETDAEFFRLAANAYVNAFFEIPKGNNGAKPKYPYWKTTVDTTLLAMADTDAGFIVVFNQTVGYKTWKDGSFKKDEEGQQERARTFLSLPFLEADPEKPSFTDQLAEAGLTGFVSVLDFSDTEARIFEHKPSLSQALLSFAPFDQQFFDSFSVITFDFAMKEIVDQFFNKDLNADVFQLETLTSSMMIAASPEIKKGLSSMFVEYTNHFRYQSVREEMPISEVDLSFSWLNEDEAFASEQFMVKFDPTRKDDLRVNFVGIESSWLVYLDEEAKAASMNNILIPAAGAGCAVFVLLLGVFIYCQRHRCVSCIMTGNYDIEKYDSEDEDEMYNKFKNEKEDSGGGSKRRLSSGESKRTTSRTIKVEDSDESEYDESDYGDDEEEYTKSSRRDKGKSSKKNFSRNRGRNEKEYSDDESDEDDESYDDEDDDEDDESYRRSSSSRRRNDDSRSKRRSDRKKHKDKSQKKKGRANEHQAISDNDMSEHSNDFDEVSESGFDRADDGDLKSNGSSDSDDDASSIESLPNFSTVHYPVSVQGPASVHSAPAIRLMM